MVAQPCLSDPQRLDAQHQIRSFAGQPPLRPAFHRTRATRRLASQQLMNQEQVGVCLINQTRWLLRFTNGLLGEYEHLAPTSRIEHVRSPRVSKGLCDLLKLTAIRAAPSLTSDT